MILIGVSLVVVMLLVPYIYKQVHYVKLSEIKQYVKDNNEYLTDISTKILDDSQVSDYIKSYDYKEELSFSSASLDKLYKDLNIREIYIIKGRGNTEDCFGILLKNKNGNFSCGIYYSPSGKLLEYGKPQEGDKYEYNDEYHNRHIYRSEKICNYWYYYEDDTWN